MGQGMYVIRNINLGILSSLGNVICSMRNNWYDLPLYELPLLSNFQKLYVLSVIYNIAEVTTGIENIVFILELITFLLWGNQQK